MRYFLLLLILAFPAIPSIAQQTDATVKWSCEATTSTLSIAMAHGSRPEPSGSYDADKFQRSCVLPTATWHVSTSWLIRDHGPCMADPNLLITITRNGNKVVDRVYADIACWEDDATFVSAEIRDAPHGLTIALCFSDSKDIEHCTEMRNVPVTPIDMTASRDLIAE